jgi:hypothetical protein
MGVPTSAILTEIFIEYKSYQNFKLISDYRLSQICRRHTTRTPQTQTTELNSIHQQVKLTIEKETRCRLNYLHLTITNLLTNTVN